MLGQRSAAVNSYGNNEIKEEENGMGRGVGSRAVFFSLLGIHDGGCRSRAARGPGPPESRGSPGVFPRSWGIIHCSQRCCCCFCLRLPCRHRRMREKQKGMGRSSGGENDVAAALRPQLSCPAGVG